MKVENAYNIWADQYDTNSNKTRDLDTKSTIETLSKLEFSSVIELGCGTGKNTIFLIKKAEKIIGLDFSQEMLNKAKLKINDKRVKFRKADLTTEWKIDNDSADLITCNLVLEHIEDLDFIFYQANKKLKNGGAFFISELHPFKQYSGSKAKFETENGTQELETYVHHISEYLNVASENGFELVELKEWFDEENQIGIPRLIGIVFRKSTVGNNV
ncbi:class I SAM-dependent DNA methyltransferase [Salegentibacter mishustinae]|jgi:ubiquinone/menaquinone biosynthesis C-methylase UbiE|uniref:Methyltransferase type 11 n=2 Tax=Bacteroidota TaxID=976 RepID=A0A0Q9ZNG5_9FLAO|nr:class I SAM-dependent methyltransferase [Salegentibacter mishustinae]KRG30040.1 methyltransferase type 11 [Salegentibacter mishustinae]PNW20556.1 methyltransferase type 11 [Salegentibacter mishustinae]PZX61561.1 methyltransferase family protein [Salegentibacter mishustinae]GGW99133.1 SAM-dependent methyltransferase [Salegentibacter mishustinae]